MPTCSQAKIITNLESDIHKRFVRLSGKECDSNNNFLNGDAYLLMNTQAPEDSTECFYSIGNKISNNIDYIDMKNANQFYNDYCKSNSTLLNKPQTHQTKLNYNSQSYFNQYLSQTRKQKSFIDYVNSRSAKTPNRLNTRRISVDELPVSNHFESQISNKVPIIFGDFAIKRESVPVNFLYNSPFRNNRNSITINQAKINSLRSSLNMKASSGGSDGEDAEEASSGISESNASEKISDKSTSSSSPVNIIKLNPFIKPNVMRKSVDHTHARTKRNIIEELRQLRQQVNEAGKQSQPSTTINIASNNLDIKDASTRKLSGLLAQFPKLALENDSTENESNNSDNLNFNSLDHEANHYLKKLSLKQAKRLLALASIRPSKTFHKTMTEEEIEILKKYYELIKPKVNANHMHSHSENDKYNEPYSPIVYDTAKVKFTSLQMLKHFLEKHKKEIDSNVYKVEYESNGFVLKHQQDENKSVKFPTEVNDAMFALTVTTSDKETVKLGEANLFRIVNWNDTAIPSLVPNTKPSSKISAATTTTTSSDSTQQTNYILKSEKTNKSIKLIDEITAMNMANLNERISFELNENSSQQFTLPSLNKQEQFSFEYIKNLSCLVGSVVESKLQKQLVYNGIDLSTLPGGSNFDIPTFEELGINLNNLLSDATTNTNLVNNGTSAAPAPPVEYQTSKLKPAAYKKLKEKVTANKCMSFNGPPERRPLDVIFEYAGVDIEHQTILDEVNKYLKHIGGHVKSLEFVPRSVHFGSVYVENQWILSLSDQNTKFFTISNGIQIKDEKISVKSYDEFIFGEYERYVRNEKYKQLIKNHEKAVQLSKAKSKK